MMMFITVKHGGIRDIMYVGHDRSILAAGVIGGLYLMTVPFTVFCTVFVVRRSPIMMPYHVFGGNEKLVELESSGSLWYCSVLVLEWAVVTVVVLGIGGPAAIVCDAICKIKLITRTMR